MDQEWPKLSPALTLVAGMLYIQAVRECPSEQPLFRHTLKQTQLPCKLFLPACVRHYFKAGYKLSWSMKCYYVCNPRAFISVLFINIQLIIG